MKLYVDADACPVAIREIIYRAAERLKIETLLVANKTIKVPPSRFVVMSVVEMGFDIADDRIADEVAAGDLVVTEDIPLADRVIAKGGFVISPHGELFTVENIKQRLAARDFYTELRGAGIESGGPAPFRQKDIRAFANQLDRFFCTRR